MKNKAMEAMLLSKKPKKKLPTAGKVESGVLTSETPTPSPLKTIDVPVPEPLGTTGSTGALPVPKTKKLAPSPVLSALQAAQSPGAKLPPKDLEGDVFLGPTEVKPSYSPIQNYLKKKKGEQ
jgi:hypothetical protein